MPELPEVECLTRAVRDLVLGSTMTGIKFYRSDLRDPIPTKDFKKLLGEGEISAVTRRSKYMLWEVDGESYGIFHLGMTGNMLAFDSAKPRIKHTHAVFELSHKKKGVSYLHFIDPRRFGRIDCCLKTELKEHRYFHDLGPEPLETENLAEQLFEASRGKSQPVKSFLMDAHNVVGVGNIYASESLFRARVSPLRGAGKVTKKEFTLIAEKIQETLNDAIAAGGTSFRDFKNSDGDPGYFALKLAVYDRKGQPCGVCGEKISIKKLSGRSTFYCRVCQR